MKMDTLRNMNTNKQTQRENTQMQATTQTTPQMATQIAMSEQEVLEMRLALLNQQEAQKLQNNAVLMKTLQDLNTSIKEAIKEVQQSANAVRTYPVEVISKSTTRMEQCLLQCEQSAKKASNTYNAGTNIILNHEKLITKYMFFWTICGSVFASLMTGIIIIWRLKG